MMNTILHAYLMLNIALALSYVFSRTAMGLSLPISQINQLKFARFCFVLAMTAFLIMPSVSSILPAADSGIEWQPLLHQTAATFLNYNSPLITQTAATSSSAFYLPWKIILTLCLSTGFIFFAYKYVRALVTLNRIRKQSYCRHKINHIHVLFTHLSAMPFCWSLLRNHFVTIPDSLLDNRNDTLIAIRHEFQHIRQGDTYWLHIINTIKLLCFWNPAVIL